MYAYCRNNPVMFDDPSGMGVWSWFKKGASWTYNKVLRPVGRTAVKAGNWVYRHRYDILLVVITIPVVVVGLIWLIISATLGNPGFMDGAGDVFGFIGVALGFFGLLFKNLPKIGRSLGAVGRPILSFLTFNWVKNIINPFRRLSPKPEPPSDPKVDPPPPTKTMTISYDGNGKTHGEVPENHRVITPGNITLKQPGNMLKEGHLFGGWKCPGNTVREPGRHYYATADDGTWTQKAVWEPVVIPSLHPTTTTAPRGPFVSANAAALAWANHMHSTSLYARHEHAAVIYQAASGEFYLTKTVSGSAHSVPIPINEVPTDSQKVAYIHSHVYGSRFSPADIRVANFNAITQKRSLLTYNRPLLGVWQ